VTRGADLVALTIGLVGLVACGGDGGSAPPEADPASSTVAISATGCRLQPTEAVGVVVEDGLVVTVAHAVAGEEDITVSTPDGRSLPGVVAAIDTELDAAVVRVSDLDLPPLPQRTYTDREPVSLVTTDLGQFASTPVEVRRRVMVRTSDIYRQGVHLRPGLELAAAVVAGDSGGGVVGADGDLLGVVWAASRQSDSRAWATPIEAFEPLVEAARAGRPPTPARCAR
jgi:S1-C subfamily serine protease